MKARSPDFYLISTEHKDFKQPRSCWIKGRMCGEIRDDGMWVIISPPVIGQKYGLGEKDIEDLILFSRLQGMSLFPINEWPLHVYIFRALDNTIFSAGKFIDSQVEMIAWGELYSTLDEANAVSKTMSGGKAKGSIIEK